MPVHKEDNVREYGGRIFNGVNYTYKLPADEEEYDRLAMQHRIITLSIGLDNNVPHLIKTAISSGGANPAAIDMGTGSGHWFVTPSLERHEEMTHW
ncbi:hypothetical protein FRC02_009467 [Tulasnella sp. 418]|nr:hypothetical protein FRC02_009467 [Tulasnella sp. 418]